ncbi:hypothetical protein FS837_011428 [Tulasnella sp. UAMH 9824]|nr:hypothetical protein FS837_011428 [Tulasnella sp. UAMH 9824]
MNGVRRFLGGGGISLAGRSTSPSDPPSAPSTPQQESMPANTAMIMSPTSATMQGFSSRGGPGDDFGSRRGHGAAGSSSSFMLPNSPTSPGSPSTTTKALFFRKEGRRQNTITSMRNWTDDYNNNNSNDSNNDYSPSRPGQTASSSSRTHTSHQSSTSFSSSRPPLSSIATTATRFTTNTDPRASPAVSGTGSSLTWRNAHSSVNMKDELLLSLLASQAVVDSKDSEILSAEDVEELKREYSLVASRVSSAARKLSTETRIRDAALKLHNSVTAGGGSKGKAEDLESLNAANRKVELAQQEFQRLSDRANDISRRLLEHRAGVLSFSVKSLEKKAAVLAGAAPHHADTDSESSHGTGFSNGEMSPASTTATSLSIANKKFDGAHFFAGHAEAITPGMNSPARVKELEEKLRQADAAVASMKKRQTELMRDLDILGLEKTEVETHMSLELQTAEERVTELEAEVQKVPDLEAQLDQLEEARRGWEKDKRDLEDRLRMAEERGLAAVAEATGNRNAEVEETMIQLRAELMAKDSENKRLLDEKRAIEEEKNSLRQSLTEHQAGATQEVIVAREALRAMCRANRVVTPLGETGLLPLIQSLEAHLSTFDQAKEQMMESRERLNAELEEARREREDARREAREMETRLKQRSDSIDSTMRRTPSPLQPPIRRPSGDAATEYDRIVALLKPIWSILPSVSARASKMGSSSSGRMTPRSPKASNGRSPDSPAMSLSELDVRSLKALYDPRANYTSPTVSGEFSFEEFATRVQALIQDDRALVERLIRFAQAHDLLRTNAERAQKLAQESSKGLETYQNQVKTLEERNMELATKQTELMDEIEDLHITMERLEEQKRAMEEQAAEQAETCKQLNEANDALSAKTLTLAAEAAAAAASAGSSNASSEQIKKLEQQLAEKQKELEDVNDLLDRTRMAESTQRVALLDELNTLQQENGSLRNQLRNR